MQRLDEVVEAATELRTPDGWAAKTYNYLRLGMLVAVAALAYSIIEEYRQPGVHCFLGSISGYYYTPVRPIFIGVMVSIGFALIVIKGRTAFEDWCFSLAGIMAPIVAFIPTSDDKTGVCREEMLKIGRYQPYRPDGFVPASINNNLHALVFAGSTAIVLAFIVFLIQRRPIGSGVWKSLAGGLAVVIVGWSLLHWAYGWVLDGHARAAVAMFGFLAAAALTNSVLGFKRGHTSKVYSWTYGIVGAAMIVSGLLFVVCRAFDWLSLGGHLVLYIEAVEISLFVAFWVAQTFERWDRTVGPTVTSGPPRAA